jgi:HK97 family phage major capsid protein
MSKIKAMAEARAKLIEEARSLYDTSDAETRSLSSEELEKFDALMDKAEEMKNDIQRAERLETEERSLEASTGRIVTGATRSVGPSINDGLRGWLLSGTEVRASEEQTAAMHALGLNSKAITFNLRDDALRSTEDAYAWANRNQGVAPLAAGGALVAPDFQRELEIAMLQFGGVRQAARIIRTATGAALPMPTVNDTGNMGRRLAEHAPAVQTDIAFGQVILNAYKYSSDVVRVSVELAQDSAINLPAEIGRALGERIGRIQSQEFTRTGTGVGQPQAIITGATFGVGAAAPGAVTYDELVDLVHSVNAAYRTGAQFMFADSTLREIRKLRDLNGELIWQAGMTPGAPATILGHTYIVNDDMPAMAAGNRSIVFGDLSKYVIRDVREVTLVRLDEVFAQNGQIGYLAFARADARMLDAGTGPIRFMQH